MKKREIHSLKQKIKDLDIKPEDKESIYKGIDSLSITSNDYDVYKNINFDLSNTQRTTIKLSNEDSTIPRKMSFTDFSIKPKNELFINPLDENKDD